MTPSLLPYALTQHNGYWASVIKSDIAKGRTLQQAANDTFRAILMMGRGQREALNVTEAAVFFSGNKVSDVKW